MVEYVLHTIMHAGVARWARCNQNRTFLKALWNRHKTHDLFSSAMLTGYIWRFKQRYVISVNYAMSRVKYTTGYTNYSLISPSQVKGLTSLTSATSTISTMGGVFAKYSVQAVAWLFSKKSGLFFGISRFKKIDTVS